MIDTRIDFNEYKKYFDIVFIFLCVISLAVLLIDGYLFWENIRIEKKIQTLLDSF